ncbi:MAG: RDD family protein [Lachnospiraceae bacterium]
MEKEYVNAPFVKRGLAFVIDAVVAFLPALVVYFIFTGTYSGLTPLYYPAPVIGAVSMIDLPVAVNEKVSTVTSDEGGIISETNYSIPATGSRMLSVFVIIFYVGYSTFCTALYDGRTVGKKLMRLRVIPEDGEKPLKAYLLRELLGKVIINSTIIVPVISLFMALFAPKRKTVHDYIGRTRVVAE